ncbi:TatD family deoxyribonuclease [Mycolicibacterium sp. P9-64]|uniref:TatD family hydrolase n=1 Tax=Mycolicibacterium sp. P9-64 TaxID=2024612 RepID=UPI0011EED4CD|nr:TatD family hydrolase [Mycolicibacterium sp. P9-64]KAA0085573.1 TatD family deoxyribonuclease [Mycolicibacterium sp. P9-64]
MTTDHAELPRLDCHAHVAPDVTRNQLATLGNSHVFAVTRSLSEAKEVASRTDPTLTWGLGVHPGVASSRADYDPDSFRQLLPQFALIGEVGLDKRGPRGEQEQILADVLEACTGRPVIISIHSTGRTSEVVNLVGRYPHPGIILHWFLGTPDDVNRAVALGAYFSVNNAMSDELLITIPRDRVLPETDYPARQVHARLPGETGPLESRLARIWRLSENEVRHLMWVNLKQLAMASGAIDSVSDSLADALLIV